MQQILWFASRQDFVRDPHGTADGRVSGMIFRPSIKALHDDFKNPILWRTQPSTLLPQQAAVCQPSAPVCYCIKFSVHDAQQIHPPPKARPSYWPKQFVTTRVKSNPTPSHLKWFFECRGYGGHSRTLVRERSLTTHSRSRPFLHITLCPLSDNSFKPAEAFSRPFRSMSVSHSLPCAPVPNYLKLLPTAPPPHDQRIQRFC